MSDRLIRQRAFFFGMVAILAILAMILVWQFVKSILLAVALVILLKPLYNWVFNKKGINGSERKATGFTILIFILLIAIPAVFIISGAIIQASNLFSNIDLKGLDFSLHEINLWIETTLRNILSRNFEIDDLQLGDTIAQAVAFVSVWLRGIVISLGRSIPGMFMNSLIVLVIMYVMLPRYRGLGKQELLDIVPFPTEITQLYLDKIDLMIKAMFRGTFIIAIAQGLAMGVVLWIAGVPYVTFLTLLSMLLSLVPLIGVSLVAWPLGIYLIISGSVWQGVFIIAAFLIVVVNIDTLLRPSLVPKGAQLNPALVLLSVFGGLSVMGIIGALYGPVVMILLVTSVEVYTKYLLRSDLEALDKSGRIDLKELGLISQDDQSESGVGEMFLTALRNVTAPFRRASPLPVESAPAGGASDENPSY